MTKQSLILNLPDKKNIEVSDCSFDLVLHLFYKNKFDRKLVDKDIDWIIKNNDESTIKKLLEKSLRQITSELANQILAKSLDRGVSYVKVIEDMLIQLKKVKFSVAENVSAMRKILELRKRIFVLEEGYPKNGVRNGFESQSLHLMAEVKSELVAAVSIAFDGPKGMPMEKFLDLRGLKENKKCVEIDKLAVAGQQRKKELSFQLMWLCYSISKFWGAEKMFIFTLSKKAGNIDLYERFGFKKIGEFIIFNDEKATALMLDFADVNTYEKHLNTDELLKLGKKLLNKFHLNN